MAVIGDQEHCGGERHQGAECSRSLVTNMMRILVVYGIDRRDSGKDLARHYAGQ